MSTQIAVRLPDDLVAELDSIVSSGQEPSRPPIVQHAPRPARPAMSHTSPPESPAATDLAAIQRLLDPRAIALVGISRDPDSFVSSGQEPSRASIVEQALLRELRRRAWLKEVEVLTAHGSTYEDLDGLDDYLRRFLEPLD